MNGHTPIARLVAVRAAPSGHGSNAFTVGRDKEWANFKVHFFERSNLRTIDCHEHRVRETCLQEVKCEP
jgi:hypothetical protein